MKQYTNESQTAKLIEMGFEKPGSIASVEPIYGMGGISVAKAYSIGELIEMLEEVASVVISYSYQKNGYYVRVIIPKRIGGGMYRISQIELIDALYTMILELKEEGVI